MSEAAQAELASLVNAREPSAKIHPEDALEKDSSSTASSDHDGSATLRSTDQSSASPSNASTLMPATSYLSTTTRFDANTGPKGVIADARSFETARKRSFRQTLYAFTESTPFKRLNAANREKSKSPTPDLSADEEEDDFMRTWRQKRLDELASTKNEVRTRRQSPSKRRYGSLVSVDPAGYLDAVEKVGTETIVIVLIYDDEYALSNKVEDALRELARKYVTTRFVKLHYQEAEMDEIAAPGILAYKGGDCFANLVSFGQELPSDKEFSSHLVEETLQRHKILRSDSEL